MSRRRLHAAEFVKLLESVAQPLYVLDDSLAIVFMNEACRAWLGDSAGELVGQSCLYHSGEGKSRAEGIAARLCPPPTVLEGRELTAAVTCQAADQTMFRAARFVPLRGADGPVFCVVAVVDSHDSPQPVADADPFPDESQALHLQLLRLRQQKRLRLPATSVAGVTPAARRAAVQAEIAAAARANVLLLGPPGGGHRRLAEAIHYGGQGHMGDSLLVPVECGLLDADLIQSTLRAAADPLRGGAPAQRGAGATERGTLLLFEVDRLSLEGQAALASPLLSSNPSWRAIATAAQPLLDFAQPGQFREDLAAALSTIVIELPPLSQRRDDVPLLAQALLEEHNSRGGKQMGGFASDALDRLCAYSWPGDVDELAQVVAESHVRAAGAQITRADLPERIHAAAEMAARPRRKEEPIRLDEFIARIERELVRRALARSKGNKAKAARLLGLNRPRLYRRMVQLGLIGKEES